MTPEVATIADALVRDLARPQGAGPTLIGMLTARSVTNAEVAQAPSMDATGTGRSVLPGGVEAVSTPPHLAAGSAMAAIERDRPPPTWSK